MSGVFAERIPPKSAKPFPLGCWPTPELPVCGGWLEAEQGRAGGRLEAGWGFQKWSAVRGGGFGPSRHEEAL